MLSMWSVHAAPHVERKLIQQTVCPPHAAQIQKSVWRLQQVGARRVALQFPEGLLMYSCIISDILEACAHFGLPQ